MSTAYSCDCDSKAWDLSGEIEASKIKISLTLGMRPCTTPGAEIQAEPRESEWSVGLDLQLRQKSFCHTFIWRSKIEFHWPASFPALLPQSWSPHLSIVFDPQGSCFTRLFYKGNMGREVTHYAIVSTIREGLSNLKTAVEIYLNRERY